MEIELLREYLVISEMLNLTDAAKSLHTTQSTLSKHLMRVENEFGTALLKRGRYGLELTREGLALRRRASVIVDSFDDAVREIQDMSLAPCFKVTGMLQNVEVVGILSRATQLLQQANGATVSFSPATGSFFSELESQRVDVAICHDDGELVNRNGISGVHLMDQPFVALVDSGHRLADRKSVSMDDLKNEIFVRLVSDYADGGWKAIAAVCRKHGFEPRTYPVMVSGGLVDCAALQLGDSVLVLQRDFMMGGMIFDSRYRALRIEDEDAVFHLSALYRTEDEKRVSFLIDALSAVTSEVSAAGSDQVTSFQRPFKSRCEAVGRRFSLNESEQEAMTSFAKGNSIDRIGQEMGLSRMMVGDILASVYKKLAVSDRQELIDLVEVTEPMSFK